MWKYIGLLVAGTALIGSTNPQVELSPKAEARLARLLEGRVAGEPVSCLKLIGRPETKVVADAAVIYGKGKTVYVNRTHTPRLLGNGDQASLTELICHNDVAEFYRPYGVGDYGLPVGSRRVEVALAEFVPYHRVSSSE